MPLRFRILATSAGAPADATATAIASNAPVPGETFGPREELRFEASSEANELFVGRRPDAALSLPFSSVSGRHARLFRGDTEREWWLEDLSSVNGTWVDEIRVSMGRPALLRAGQRLRFGTIDVLFDGWSSTPVADEGTATLARRLISDLFSSPDSEVPTLTVHEGPVRAQPLRLTQRDRRYLTGRADTCDLVLPSEHVSREHAAFLRRREGVFVQDLGSRNPVRVNGVPITTDARLADGDRIEVGAVVLAISDPEQRYGDQVQRLGGPGVVRGAAVGERVGIRTGTPTVGLPVVAADVGPRETPVASGAADRTRGSGTRERARAGASLPASRSPRRTLALIAAGAVVVLAVAGLIVLLVTAG